MFKVLINYVREVADKKVNNNDVVSVIEATMTAINNSVIPVLKDVNKSEEFYKTDRIELIGRLSTIIGLRQEDPAKVIKELLTFFKDVLAEEKNLVNLVRSDTNATVYPQLATAQEVAIMKTITDITTVTLYTNDLIYYVMAGETSTIPAGKVKSIKEGLGTYGNILNTYLRNFDKHVINLGKVAKVGMKEGTSEKMMDSLLATHGVLVDLPLVNNFVNNPIYHVRMWMVDGDLEKYESLKEKKKLIELRLVELKMRKHGKSDERLAKQIEYYEDKVSSMEYDMKDLHGTD